MLACNLRHQASEEKLIAKVFATSLMCPLFRHLLVVFGGLQGLEASLDADQNLDVSDPCILFDLYLNTCPSQGSRTIRTEVR